MDGGWMADGLIGGIKMDELDGCVYGWINRGIYG